MTDASIALLPDRGVIGVRGDDAAHLLDSLITNALAKLDGQPAIHAGLLSPKGKILFDFFVLRHTDGYLLETARTDIDGLMKRLSLYRLRAKVEFRDLSENYAVAAVWGGTADLPTGAVAYPDPRGGDIGLRVLVPAGSQPAWPEVDAGAGAYAAHRIACAIPEAGQDYTLGEAFPHEAMYDLLGSADFSKGCFIGQEVVSRMHHLGTPRNRIVGIAADSDIPPRTEILADGTHIGRTGSTAGRQGMALVRLDRAHDAAETDNALAAGSITIRLVKPAWAALDMATGARAASE